MSFRFQDFADAPSAQAAFEAAHPPGSPADAALQALIAMGAHCKSVGPDRFACRYIETENALTAFSWHVVVDCREKVIQRVGVGVALLGL